MQPNLSPLLVVGAGWLGEPLAQRLQTQGQRVVVTARQADRIQSLQAAGLSAWRLDLADAGESFGLHDRLKAFRTLLLAIPPAKGGGLLYADQLKFLLAHWPEEAGRKIVFYSSTSVYPDQDGSWKEEDELQTDHPVSQAESVIGSWGKNVLILRCGGLCDERRIIGRYFAGKILPNADQPVNYVHREDVIGATLHLLERETNGIFNVVAPLHPTRQAVFQTQANRYQFAPPLTAQAGGIHRIIDAEKLLATGYTFLHPDPQLF